MTEEQIKQKAEAEADKIIIGSGMDRASVIHLKHLLVTMYMQGATEATKELVIKDKLKKEAEEWLCNNLHSASEEDFIKAMVDFAEPREKQIQVLGEHCLQLQKDKGNLTDRCTDLEAEVKEWKDKADLWCKTANLKDHNIMINKELEKENAELKAVERMALYSKMSDQLTKAKEIIKKYLAIGVGGKITQNYLDVTKEAEQFLKENA